MLFREHDCLDEYGAHEKSHAYQDEARDDG